MRIGIEAQRIFRKKKHGMDIYALELIRTLQKIDLENEYFIFVKPDEDRCLTETKNFKIVEVSGLTYVDWEQIRLPIVAKKYNLDLLHCTSNTAPLLTSIPLIITLHDIIYLNQKYQGGSLYQRLGHVYRKWIVPIVYKKAKRVFTVSEFERKNIGLILGEVEKLSVSYNGVSSMFKPVANEKIAALKSSLKLPKEYIFFLGNKAPKKNMKGVLQAYALYRKENKSPLPLVIAESDSNYLDQLLKELSISEIRPFLYLTGYLPHSELPTIYSGASLFLYPSLIESFGIPIIEAMACGIPVITSFTSSMPEVAGKGALLVDPLNPMEIAKSITSIQISPKLKQFMVSMGKEQSARFSWNATAITTRRHYLSI